jgi:hypothetical protein
MKHCTYLVDILGDHDLVFQLKRYLPRSYSSLSQAREVCGAIDTLFGNSVRAKLSVVRNTSKNVVYSLPPISERHN